MAAIGFAAMQIVTRRAITRIQPATVNAMRLVMAFVVLQLLPEGRAVWRMPGDVWSMVIAAGVLGPGLSRLSLMSAVRYVSPSLSALIALIGPIFAFGLGAIFLWGVPDRVGYGWSRPHFAGRGRSAAPRSVGATDAVTGL